MFIGILYLLLTVVAFAAVIAWLFIFNRRQSSDDETTPTVTRVLLIALRLVIGWHIFVEGRDKLKSDTWTSAGYLRNASGPLADRFRGMAGDRLIDKLTLSGDKLPPALSAEWQNYLDAFKSHYNLDQEQSKNADHLFNTHSTELLKWLRSGTEKITIPSVQPPPLEVYWTMEERLAEYKKRLAKVHRIESDLPEYGSALFAEYQTARSHANQLRGGMQRDLAKKTAEMKGALRSVLSHKAQLERSQLKNPWTHISNFSNWTLLDWSDFVVKWGLAITGVCLIAGLFTRTFCVIGALYLLMFYLAMPPFPWLPAPPQTEGHYLFINKNVIEMLALLMLASTTSGRWVGLDGLIHACWRSIFPREPKPEPQKPAPQSTDSNDSTEGDDPPEPVVEPSSKSEEIQHVS